MWRKERKRNISVLPPPLDFGEFCPEEEIKIPEKHSGVVYVEIAFKT